MSPLRSAFSSFAMNKYQKIYDSTCRRIGLGPGRDRQTVRGERLLPGSWSMRGRRRCARMLEAFRPDVAVIDFNLPKLFSLELCVE